VGCAASLAAAADERELAHEPKGLRSSFLVRAFALSDTSSGDLSYSNAS
jgi:hypothetical protein